MATASGNASKVAAFIIFTVNLVAVILSLSTFAVGLWIITSPKSLVYIIQVVATPTLKAVLTADSLCVSAGVATCLLSLFFLFVSFMGLYGAIYRSPFLLFMYAALVFLLMLLECALFYYYTFSVLEKGVEQTDGQIAHMLRLALRCCDANSTLPEIDLPWSCCGTDYPKNCTREKIYDKDCRTSMSSFLHYKTLVYSTITVSHVVLSSLSLLRRASSASRSHT